MKRLSLDTLVTGLIFISYIFSPIIGWSTLFLLLKTPLWWLSLLYLAWFYYDRKAPELGSRSFDWIQYGNYWKYCRNYLDLELRVVPGFTLDPKRNYLFCGCPHGIIPIGLYLNMISGGGDFHRKFPNFKAKLAVIHFTFFSPFVREVIMGMGFMSCTVKAISSVLSKPTGGNVVCLNPGGAVEAYLSRPGEYRFFLKNRKGFVKLALKNGTPIVPLITFGESNAFEQMEIPSFRPFQEFVRKKLQFAPILFKGTGFITSFGLVPKKVPLKTVVGSPIEVRQSVNPTNQEVDDLHESYLRELGKLFEAYKHDFLVNSEDTKLIIE